MSDGSRVQMPKGEKDDGVQKWFTEIERGIKAREVEEKRWEANEKYEDLEQWSGKKGVDDEITVNKVGSYIRTYRARIAFNDPRAKLSPANSDGYTSVPIPIMGPDGQPVGIKEVQRYKLREALLNDVLGSPMHNTQAVNSRLVKAGLIGWGCLKSVYWPTFETDPEPEGEQPIPIGEDGALDFSQYVKNPVSGALEVSDDDRLLRRDSIPMYEDFAIKWVPYRNMVTDPDGGNDWGDHRWVCEECVRSLEDVKADPLYKNTKDLKASGYRKDDGSGEYSWGDGTNSGWSDVSAEVKQDKEVVRLFEIYDLVNEKMIVLADGHGKYLRNIPTPLGISGHPYSDFRPNEVLGKFYQRPIVTDLCPINQWYNAAGQKELRAMDHSTRKVLVRKGALNQQMMEQLTSNEDMAVVEWDNRGAMANLPDVIAMLQSPPVPGELFRIKQDIARDFDEIGGLSEPARGSSSDTTATEINVMESYSGSRIDFDRKVLAECWKRAIKKLNDLIDANMTTERAVRLEGAEGQAFVAMIDPDMIAGDFDVDVDVEDMAPKSSAVEGAQMIQMLQVAGQAPWLFAQEPLARGFCEKFGVKDQKFIEALVQMAQMQMAMAQAAAAPPPSPNAPPPGNEADAISQAGAGGQAPSMQRSA